MRIAILGAGSVGGGLGAAFTRAGHSVVYGVRDPDSAKARAAVEGAPGSTATSPASAVAAAEIVVFALRWPAAAETITELPSLDGRIVIDAMNRFDGDAARSTAQDLAEQLPGARVVKAFNTIGFENFTTAHGRSSPAIMPVAGDDPAAKGVVLELAGQLGFEPEDAGSLVNAKALEAMVVIWLAFARRHGRSVAFALSRA